MERLPRARVGARTTAAAESNPLYFLALISVRDVLTVMFLHSRKQ